MSIEEVFHDQPWIPIVLSIFVLTLYIACACCIRYHALKRQRQFMEDDAGRLGESQNVYPGVNLYQAANPYPGAGGDVLVNANGASSNSSDS